MMTVDKLEVARISTPHSDHHGTGEAIWAQMIVRECLTRLAADDGSVTTCEHVTSDTPVLIPAWAPVAVCFFCADQVPEASGLEADTCDGCLKTAGELGDVLVNLGRATVMGSLCWECWHPLFPMVPKPDSSRASPVVPINAHESGLPMKETT